MRGIRPCSRPGPEVKAMRPSPRPARVVPRPSDGPAATRCRARDTPREGVPDPRTRQRADTRRAAPPGAPAHRLVVGANAVR